MHPIVVWLMEVFDVKTVPGLVSALAVTLGAITALWAMIRKVRRRWLMFWQKAENVYDSIVGSDAILDPETGKVLREARLSLGSRVAVIEEWQAATVESLSKIAQTLEKQQAIEVQLASIMDRQQQHEEWSEKWTRDHDIEADEDHRRLWKAIHELGGDPAGTDSNSV